MMQVVRGLSKDEVVAAAAFLRQRYMKLFGRVEQGRLEARICLEGGKWFEHRHAVLVLVLSVLFPAVLIVAHPAVPCRLSYFEAAKWWALVGITKGLHYTIAVSQLNMPLW